MIRDYQPFVIEVEDHEEKGFSVQAHFGGTRTWESTIPHELPMLKPTEIEQGKQWLERGFLDRDYTKDLGRQLFQALFQDNIREGFRTAYGIAAKDGDGLRIVLTLPQNLEDLPWELMYDEEGGHGFLARSTTAPLVRHYAMATTSHNLPKEGPLRILLVTASPQDLGSISSDEEAEMIKKSLSRKRNGFFHTLRFFVRHLSHTRSISDFFRRIRSRNLFEIEILPHATKRNLQRKIQGNQKGYHVVHFIGHGKSDKNGSWLAFESEDSNAELVTSEAFAEILSESTINLTVLNACETTSTSGLFQSVAKATLHRGVPVVIGMQVPILDRTAVGFAEEFYGAWAAGQPIERALSYARRLVKEETPGAAADWGIPILYMRSVGGSKLDLASSPLRTPPVFRFLKWTINTVIGLLGLIGVAFAVPVYNQQMRTEVPIIRCFFPYPMGNGFNVVINEFTVLDEDGSVVAGKDGQAVAEYIYNNLSNNFDELNLGENYSIRPPEHTCLIRGVSRAERETNAAAFAEKINADIVVYGVIQKGDGLASFSPEFYVNYKSFQEAGEITGEHEFGDSLSVSLPFDLPRFNPTDNPALAARTEALSLVTVGLSYYSIDNFEEASKYFLQAQRTRGWLELPGKEIIYLLLGNTGNRRYSVEKNTDYAVRAAYLDEALINYDKALGLNDSYARAMVGKGGTLYLQSLGNPDDNDLTNLGLAKLDEAVRLYNDARNLITTPDTANIETKVHFGLGKIYLARYLYALMTNGDSNAPLSMADSEFNAVLEEYNDGKGNVRVANLAGHSYAFLGVIARVQRNYDEAIALTTRAIEIVSPYYKSSYNITLGNIYVEICSLELAKEAYRQADGNAKLYGFADLITESSNKMDEIKNSQCSPASR